MSIAIYNQPVANNVIKIIDEKGLKQKAVAEKMGLSAQTLNSMLNNKKVIKVSDIPMFAKALGVTPNDLLGYTSA